MNDRLIPASDLLLAGARASVQRATLSPRDGFSANLGAASCILLSADPHSLRVAVAVPPGEALWIGLSLAPDTEFVSAKIGNLPLKMETIGTRSGGVLFLRSSSFGGKCSESVEIILCGGGGVAEIRLETIALQSFNAQFGLTEHHNSSPATYGRWRLP